jgi:division protein 1
VTCLQFDEIHIVSGSLDKSIRVSTQARAQGQRVLTFFVQVWDVRTGGTFETLKYDHGVTTLQFDTRKIVAATGENGIKVQMLSARAPR